MKARRSALAAAALLAAGCGRDPAPRPPAADQATPSNKVRLVAPVPVQAKAEAKAPAAVVVTPGSAEASPVTASVALAPLAPLTPSGQAAAAAKVSPASFPPRNECAALPGFAAFRDKLAAAVRKRDAAAMAALADPAVRLDFGGGAGRDELRARLSSGRDDLWGQLRDVLDLGCAADGDLATMPWVFSRMPDSVDPYRAMLVRGEKVPLRERPSAGAPVKAELSWTLVVPVAAETDPQARFVEVETAERTMRGFVDAGRLRGLLDYRLIAEPQAGDWAITAFIAGD